MAEFQFEPVYVESHEPFSLTHQINWFVGTSFDASEDTPASSLPGSGDEVVLNGYDVIGSGETYGSVDDGLLDSGTLTAGTASYIGVAEAGASFKLANGDGGQTSFTPVAGSATLYATTAVVCAVGADGTLHATDADSCVVSGGTLDATDITNTDSSENFFSAYAVTVAPSGLEGGSKGISGGGKVNVTSVINTTGGAVYMFTVAGKAGTGTVTATNIYSAANATAGMGNEVDGTGQTLIVDYFDDNAATLAGLTNVLDIYAGGTVKIVDAAGFGRQEGDTSNTTISGAKSLLDVEVALNIGLAGTSTFSLSAGGTLESLTGFLGGLGTGDGSVTLSGTGTSWIVSGAGVQIGDFGHGTLTIENGASLNAVKGVVDIGVDEGGTGELDLDGSTSSLKLLTAPIRVGDGGTGTFKVEDGQQFTGTEIDVGVQETANGTLDVEDGRVTLTSLYVGGNSTSASGASTGAVSLTQEEGDAGPGGQLLVNGNMTVWDEGDSVTLSSTEETDQSGLIVSKNVLNDGTITAGEYGDLQIDGAITGSGSIDIGGHGLAVLKGAVASSQDISFDGENAKLEIGSASTFKATISGFAATDIIDLTGLAFNTGSKVTLIAPNTIKVTPTTGTAIQLTLASAPAGTLALQKDTANGGTDIVLNGPGAVPNNNNLQLLTQAVASFGVSSGVGGWDNSSLADNLAPSSFLTTPHHG
jgi:T5SS/PEP-CTERM-associated repeat protein